MTTEHDARTRAMAAYRISRRSMLYRRLRKGENSCRRNDQKC